MIALIYAIYYETHPACCTHGYRSRCLLPVAKRACNRLIERRAERVPEGDERVLFPLLSKNLSSRAVQVRPGRGDVPQCVSRKNDSYPSTRRRALQIAREESPGRDLERQTRRTHVRVGRARRQRSKEQQRRSPKSACPLSLMNLHRGSSPSRGEGGKSTGVSCARFGTQSKQTATATGSF